MDIEELLKRADEAVYPWTIGNNHEQIIRDLATALRERIDVAREWMRHYQVANTYGYKLIEERDQLRTENARLKDQLHLSNIDAANEMARANDLQDDVARLCEECDRGKR